MKYYNETTYPSDVSCNSTFRIQEIAAQSNIANELETLLASLVSRSTAPVGKLRNLFDCSDVGVKIIAALAHYDGYLSSPERIASILRMSILEITCGIEDLFAKGLINQIPDSDAIILTNSASQVITKNAPLCDICDDEIIARMRRLPLLNEEDDDDIEPCYAKLFKDVLSMKPGGNIAEFVRENQIEEFPLAVQDLFWALCINYVQKFTAPYTHAFNHSAMSELIKKGWVDTFASGGEQANDLTKKDNYCLSAAVATKLFAGKEELINYSTIATLGTFKSWMSIDEKALFFNESDKEALQRIERIAGEEEYSRIKKGLIDKHLRVSISAIFYGPSGTGKTEFAMQVARKTKRNIILVDAGKLHGSFWGEDERNFRDLFRIFRNIEALSTNAPILFIDEGEGILGQRTANAQTRGDRSSNIVQNIILEELNDFRGILYITTNDASNIDKAMDRRFLTKIEFHVPDEANRAHIWRSKLPNLSESHAMTLARMFSFSGGHIDNVVTQVSIDELLDNKKFTIEDVINYCKREDEFTSKNNVRKIGF